MKLRRKRYRHVTPDELAAIGRPGMIASSLQCATLMRSDLHPRVVALAESRGDTSPEGMFAALKDVWASSS